MRPEGVLGYVHRRRRSRMRTVFVWFCVLLLVGFVLLMIRMLLPQGSRREEVVVIPEEAPAAIAALRNSGALEYERAFRVLLGIRGGTIQPGQYTIAPRQSVWSLARLLTTTIPRRERSIQIIEGWNTRDIAAYLDREGIATPSDLFALIGTPATDVRAADVSSPRPKDFSLEFSILTEKPDVIGLEGYLFPDTYRVYDDATVEDIVRTMLRNFDRKITLDLRKEIVASGRSLHQIITMASIIEAEIARSDDRPTAAGILWKRRDRGMRLQVDASVNYITGKHDPRVALTDAALDSAYNTYRYPGLPRGPINSPGMDAILAALRPTASPYWFFLTTTDGKTVFSRTLDEHNANVVRYLR